MKEAILTIKHVIEEDIDNILENAEKQEYSIIKEFEFGEFTYDVSYNELNNKFREHWEPLETNIVIEIKSVTINNEKGKKLKRISKEVFNQLEQYYEKNN